MPKLSQHFLVDSNFVKRMVSYAELKKDDIVLEIGPGKGIITEEISKHCKIVAIEKDRILAEALPFEVITGDALHVEFPKFNKIISNIPFEISSPITFKFFKYNWDVAILIFQREFAKRFVAKPGDKDYSRLTVAINYYCKPEIIEKIPKSMFRPIPKVDAALVKLTLKKPEFETGEKFWLLVNNLFQHKRKIVRAALKDSKYLNIDKMPEELLLKRVFRCDIQDIKKIYDLLSK